MNIPFDPQSESSSESHAQRVNEPMSSPVSGPLPTLSSADAAVLDAWMAQHAAGLDQGPMPVGSAARARKVQEVFALLDTIGPGADPAEDAPASLTGDTMQALRDAVQRDRFAAHAEPATAARGLGFSIRQVATAAAVGLIAVSLLLPMMSRGEQSRLQSECADQLMQASQGVVRYAADHDGLLPYTSMPALGSGLGGDGLGSNGLDGDASEHTTYASSLHLGLLTRGDYVEQAMLQCPAEQSVQGTYSYVNMTRDQQVRLEASDRLAILGDHNPRYVDLGGGLVELDPTVPTITASRTHSGRGQNVLLSDGAVDWTITPLLQRPDGELDNLWTRDLPSRSVQDDSHLAP